MDKRCAVTTCDKSAVAKGYCYTHYRAMRLYGNPLTKKQVQFHGLTVRERFWKWVKKTADCWLWVGYRDPNGYGRMNLDGVPQLASRVSWLLHYGEIPADTSILHKCDTPHCVNPEHLFVGTQQDNIADMHRKGRARQGHALGTAHGHAKLTDERVRAIRSSNATDAALARQYGVSRPTIYAIRRRQTWRHVPD